MSRTSSQRRGFPRNFGFKAMVGALHIAHSTTNAAMAENKTGLGVLSGGRLEEASKKNFLKLAAKKLKREGSGIGFFAFRSSSDGWISFREYESRMDDQTKSETNVRFESVTPYSEAQGSVHRICFDEAKLDQLPTLEQGHVLKIVASLEEKLRIVKSEEQKPRMNGATATDIGNDMEPLMACTQGEEGSVDTAEPKDVVQSISSFRPLHFSSDVPNHKGIWSLQKPVAMVKPARDLSAGQKIITDADSKAETEGDVTVASLRHGFEKGAPDVNTRYEADEKYVTSETQANELDPDMNRIDLGKDPKQGQRRGRRLYFTKRDSKGKQLKEGESYQVGDTIGIARSSTAGSLKQEGNTEEMARATADGEPRQRSVVIGHMTKTNMTAGQDPSHADEEHVSTTESTRTGARNRSRKERLLGMLTPSFYRD